MTYSSTIVEENRGCAWDPSSVEISVTGKKRLSAVSSWVENFFCDSYSWFKWCV